DPNFALAQARLSHLESWMFYAIEPLPARAQKARAAAEEALRLQPDLPESHLAMGYVDYYVDRDYDSALGEFAVARGGLPNDPGIFRAMAAIQRAPGKMAGIERQLREGGLARPERSDPAREHGHELSGDARLRDCCAHFRSRCES